MARIAFDATGIDPVRSRLRLLEPDGSRSAVYSLLGHKGDIMLVHFREDFEQLQQAELTSRASLRDYLEPATSYLSVVELGLYESTTKVYACARRRRHRAAFRGVEAEIEATLQRQRKP